jgi:hypothetical protein
VQKVHTTYVSEEEIKIEGLKAALDKRVINEALVSFIVLHNLPFRAVVQWNGQRFTRCSKLPIQRLAAN